MRELIIISYDPATKHQRHYVYEPTGNSREGMLVGSMFVAGNMLKRFNTYSDAEQYVINNR